VSTEIYNSLLRTYLYVGKVPPRISELMIEDNVSPDEETDNLLKQMMNLKKCWAFQIFAGM
jgi:hypothetical protein